MNHILTANKVIPLFEDYPMRSRVVLLQSSTFHELVANGQNCRISTKFSFCNEFFLEVKMVFFSGGVGMAGLENVEIPHCLDG